MKTLILIFGICSLAAFTSSCENANGRYVDLNTGERIDLVEDSETGLLVHADTRKPVKLYVDTRTNDTIYGETGKVVNGSIRKGDGGIYVYEGVEGTHESSGDYGAKSANGEYKIKNGDYKKEVEKDGDITIKDGDKKIKIDGETGEKKVKHDD